MVYFQQKLDLDPTCSFEFTSQLQIENNIHTVILFLFTESWFNFFFILYPCILSSNESFWDSFHPIPSFRQMLLPSLQIQIKNAPKSKELATMCFVFQ